MSLIIYAVVGVIVLAAFNRPLARLLKSIGTHFNIGVSKAAEDLAKVDPVGVYKLRIEECAEKAKKSSKVLELSGRQLTSLKRQVSEGNNEQIRLSNRIQTTLAAGDPNNTVEKYALELEKVERDLEANASQLKNAESIYNINLSTLKSYQEEIVNARRNCDHLGLKLEQSAAEKELVKMTSDLNDSLSFSDLSQARKNIQDAIDQNSGSVQATRDLAESVFAEKADEALERSARANSILDRFKPKAVNN